MGISILHQSNFMQVPFFPTTCYYRVLYLLEMSTTESMRSETPCQLSQRGVRPHVNWVNTENTNIYEYFIIPRWLSWRGVSLRVDSVDLESYSALTQLTRNEIPRQLSHRLILQNLNKFDKCKKQEQKISCGCTFKKACSMTRDTKWRYTIITSQPVIRRLLASACWKCGGKGWEGVYKGPFSYTSCQHLKERGHQF